jgi:hypothetical protein
LLTAALVPLVARLAAGLAAFLAGVADDLDELIRTVGLKVAA